MSIALPAIKPNLLAIAPPYPINSPPLGAAALLGYLKANKCFDFDFLDHVLRVETSAGAKIANARFAVYGKSVYPDANFNLRIEYGTVAGYEEDTTLVPFKTTFFGLFDRANSFNEKPPYHLPPRWKDAKSVIDLSTPLNFVYSADTIGGNSGSPVINRNAEIVGINFDSNIQKLPNRYWYVDESEGGRAVGVHSSSIIEALKKLYGAQKLVNEILGQ